MGALIFFFDFGPLEVAPTPLEQPYRPRAPHPADPTRHRVAYGSDTRHRIPASPSDSRFRMTDEDVL